MPKDVFISHATEDSITAAEVCELLEVRGIQCWIAPRDVATGAKWDEAIVDAIGATHAFLLMLSKAANESSYVSNEVNHAFSHKKTIFTFRIEDVVPGKSLGFYLARHHSADGFPRPLDKKIDALAAAISANVQAAGAEGATPVAAPARKVSRLAAYRAVITRRWERDRLAWSLAAVALITVAAMAIPTMRHAREVVVDAPEMRLREHTWLDGSPDFALSPDGRQIVFVASGDGASRLWLRPLATTTAQPLAGTEGARFPFWSPDSRSVGFFTGNALKRLDLGGASPQTLAPVINGNGGTWNADGVIGFTPSRLGPLSRVFATRGEPVAVTTLGPHQSGHLSPHFLPDGRRFLFYVYGGPDVKGIYLGALDGSAPARLTPADSAGVYLPSGPGPGDALRGRGWLLWTRAGTLVARRLDVARTALTGEPVTLADSAGAVSVAATGLVAYRTAVSSSRQLTWVDRSGTLRGTVGDPDATVGHPRVSPDGRRVVVDRTVEGNQDIWLLDGAHMSRLTFDAAVDRYPVWSPDGTRVAFASNRSGQFDLYQKLTSGAGIEERVATSDQLKSSMSWSADGRFLLYNSTDLQANTDLWVVPMVGDRTPSVFLQTPFREIWGAFSPDGRWVAYQSNESGRNEIYVRPAVPPSAASPTAAGGPWEVSMAGGIYPVWRPDGKELYYLNPAGTMMAAPMTVTGSTLAPGAPIVLFPTHIYGGGVDAQQGLQYDVATDGRFLINTVLDDAVAAPITVVVNWQAGLKK